MINYIKYLYAHVLSCVSIHWSNPKSYKKFYEQENPFVLEAQIIKAEAKQAGGWQGYLTSEGHLRRLNDRIKLGTK